MIKRDYYLNRIIHNMWNGEIKADVVRERNTSAFMI